MASQFTRRTPAPVRHSAWLFDLALAFITVVGVVTGIEAAGDHEPMWQAPIPFGVLLGALLLFRRRWPMTVLILSIGAIFVYNFLTRSKVHGWIWPASAAYFSAACTPRVRWVAVIGAAQIIYAAADLWWELQRTTVSRSAIPHPSAGSSATPVPPGCT
ncbi:MAG: hypothetical protein GEV11_24340 [Streptosporangiales bacterium]|nr:hypothetical protein [Streptosporangiales bacterium]